MSKAGEVSEAIMTLENIASEYMGYNAMVGGIVSQGCQSLAETRELLKKPTRKNIQEAKKESRHSITMQAPTPLKPQTPSIR